MDDQVNRPREMDMEIAGAPVAQQPLDEAFDLAPLGNVGVNDQIVETLAPQC